MSPRALLRRLSTLCIGNFELIVVCVVLIVAQPMVPSGTLLARNDLAPWLALSVSLVVFVRGGRLGPGPHPMLSEQRPFVAGWLRQSALAVIPWALLSFYDAARLNALEPFGIAVGLSCLAIFLRALGGAEGATAWDPPGLKSGRLWGLGGATVIGLALGLGRATNEPSWVVPAGVWMGGLLSLQFVTVGLMAGRTANLRQRLQAARTRRHWIKLTTLSVVLAILGPAIGYASLTVLYARVAEHEGSFSEAYIATLFVATWAAILWRRPAPVGVACLLHEVVPSGGKDATPDTTAIGFESPPEGALRLNPLHVRRARTMHPWIVPVRRARIGDLDDPVRPLWGPARLFPLAHILGEASFEPDNGVQQWSVITIRLAARGDTSRMTEDDAQTRRIVVLRPFPRIGGSGKAAPRTYRWQERLPAESVQVIDATTETCTLIHGDIVVISAEGVARAYEVEFGTTLWSATSLLNSRTPQIEDYTRVR